MKNILQGFNTIACLVFICGLSAPLVAQFPVHVSVNPWQFDHLTKSDGLASNVVVDMVQDSIGFWWLATDNGLQRFDGKYFTTFTHDPADPGSLPSDVVNAVWIDGTNRLWVATSQGVCRYDAVSGKFSPVPADSGVFHTYNPTRYFRDSSGGEWLITAVFGGIYRYDSELDVWKQAVKDVNVLSGAFAEPASGNIWFVYKHGLGLLERATSEVWLSEKRPEKHPLFRQAARPAVLTLDSQHKLWVTCLAPGSPFFQVLTYDLKTGVTATQNHIFKSERIVFREDSRHRLWFFSGDISEFGYFDVKTGAKWLFKVVPGQRNIPSYGTEGITNVVEDREGNLWLLTNKGVYVFNPDRQQIRYCGGFLDGQGQAVPLHEGIGFLETSRGEIWVGTFFSGINVFDQDFRLLRRYIYPKSPLGTPDIDKNENYNAVWSFTQDARGRVWSVGQFGTIQLFESDGKLLRKWRLDPPYRSTLRMIARDLENDIWTASQQGWLGKINPDDGQIEVFDRIPKRGNIHYVAPDLSRQVWLGKEGAIFRFNPLSNQVDGTSVSEPDLRPSIRGLIPWNDSTFLAYGNLLYFLDKGSMAYRRSDELKRTPLSNILVAAVDDAGTIWCTTRSGFASWDVAGNRVCRYCLTDGLSEDEFYAEGTFFRLKDGRMLFSTGSNGFYYFHPDSVSRQSLPPDVTVVRVTGGGRLLQPDSGEGLYTCAYFENLITVSYACLSWYQQKGIRYRYRLLGQSEEWIDNGDKQQITLYGMAPGAYTLQIQAINRFGLYSRGITAVGIRIGPPWWASSLAIAVYAILLLCSGYLLYRFLLRRKLEQADIQRIRELEAFKSRFFENITHELRTPLTILRSAADLIAENPKTELAKGLDTIRANVKRMLTLVNQLLDLSRLDNGLLRLHIQRVELVSFLNYLSDSQQLLAKTRDINLQFQCDLHELYADFDAERLRQIIDNLLSNALKFTPGGGTVTISLEQSANPSRARISVKDTGAGIAEDELPRLFERYYQGDHPPVQSSEGTGIGLSLARELARLMGGDLYATGEPGKGALFTFELPLSPVGTAKTDMDVSSYSSPKPDDQRPSLLIIEDNSEVARYLVAILVGVYDVQVATDGLAGLQEAFNRIPDLIISDVMMPGVDGFSLVDTLKSDPRTSHIPIILLTARAGIENKLQGIARGADAFLEKPFEKDELLAVARQLVQSRILLRQYYLASLGLIDEPVVVSPSIVGQENTFLDSLVIAVEQHLSDPAYSVEQLATQLLMSHSSLYRKIKAVSGLSPTLFIRSIRLKHARSLLIERPDMPVYAVAAACGFEDSAYFGRVFHEEFKISPAAWRSSNF